MSSPLLESLFDGNDRRPLTVSELNRQVRENLERNFSSVWLEGEISNFFEASSGHWYFSLNDAEGQLKAACYRGSNWKIRFKPFDGLMVRVRGKVTLYEPRGEYQLLVDSLEPVGEGAIKVAFEQVRAKLEQERLFDREHKRPLPFFPKRVGVVTSPDGAAYFDILNVLTRRTRSVSIVLIPARVQGESAPSELRQAISLANRFNGVATKEERIDVLIVGRGGGSAEDLSAFNEETLAREIFSSKIPVISAVGHEIDNSIADLVADVRAPTPSAAAEIVARSEDRLTDAVSGFQSQLEANVKIQIGSLKNRYLELAHSNAFGRFESRLEKLVANVEDLQWRMTVEVDERVADLSRRLESASRRIQPVRLARNVGEKQSSIAVLEQRSVAALKRVVAKKDEALKVGAASLDALSPLAVLGRGFSISRSAESGEILRDAEAVSIGEEIDVRLDRGEFRAKVSSTNRPDSQIHTENNGREQKR